MTSSRRAWLVWAVGVAAYVVAVLHRTSLGVAGLEATERFDASAALLATLRRPAAAGLRRPAGARRGAARPVRARGG